MATNLVQLISEAEIAATVERLAQALDRDYQNRSPIVIGVLKGSFMFVADLVRKMNTPIRTIEFIQTSSYGAATVSSGKASVVVGIAADLIQEQDVIVVEDIIDTGITTAAVLDELGRYQPKSLKLCALLDKPDRRQVPVPIDYLGLTIPDRFIVGYGTDFNQQYRQLPVIYSIEFSD